MSPQKMSGYQSKANNYLHAMSSKRHLKRFINPYLAGEEGCAAERSRSETNGIREGLVQCSVNVSDFWTGSSAAQ